MESWCIGLVLWNRTNSEKDVVSWCSCSTSDHSIFCWQTIWRVRCRAHAPSAVRVHTPPSQNHRANTRRAAMWRWSRLPINNSRAVPTWLPPPLLLLQPSPPTETSTMLVSSNQKWAFPSVFVFSLYGPHAAYSTLPSDRWALADKSVLNVSKRCKYFLYPPLFSVGVELKLSL